MFVGLKQPFEQGKRVKGTLQFEKAGTVEVEYAVEAIGGTPGGGHDAHKRALSLLKALGVLLRLGERQRLVGRDLRAERVQRHRDQRVIAADADQLDHACVAEEAVRALVGFVADAAHLVDSLTKSMIAFSSFCADFGSRPAWIAFTVSGFTPAFNACGSCAIHSYCAFQICAVTRIAVSDCRGDSEVL